MRGQYTAIGFDLFGCLIAPAYGLRSPTCDEIRLGDELVHRPRRKRLPTGQGRDAALEEIASPLRQLQYETEEWLPWSVKGHAYFDGHPGTARWIQDYALKHAESWNVRLSFPLYKEWMIDNGDERIAEWHCRFKAYFAPKYSRRDDQRPFEIQTRLLHRPELIMLSQSQYLKYAPRTSFEEAHGILVARRNEASIIFGRTIGTKPKHGHTAHLRIGGHLWMSTDDREKYMMMNYARQCPPGADAFVGGLGLGLIVLYLANRCRCITVAEIDQDVIELIWPRLVTYCSEKYPDLVLRLYHGDARIALASEPERYDYVFCDWWPNANKEHWPLVEEARVLSEQHQLQAVIVCWAEEAMRQSKSGGSSAIIL